MTNTQLRRAAVAVCGAAALLAVSLPAASADDHVVADGLVSPLGFAFGDDGSLYVAEAFAGKLTAIRKDGTRTTLASGPEGTGTAGIDARGRGKVVYTVTLPPELGGQPDTTLNRIRPNQAPKTLTSLAAFEAANNPDQINTYGLVDPTAACLYQAEAAADIIGPANYPGQVESNPYAVAIDSDGSSVVADAAGNSVVRVSANGKRSSTVAVLPPIVQTLTEEALGGVTDEQGNPVDLSQCVGAKYASNPVPTDVEIGPGGNYLVSALPGFPESPGAGTVFTINKRSGAITKRAVGFSGAVDIAVAKDRTLYVAELFAGQVSTVAPGQRQASTSTPVDCPTAAEIGPDGGLYVAEGGICSDGPPAPGRVIRVIG
jgi:hypothetical protein